MAKTPEELEKMFSDLSDRQSKQEKEFELKLESANRTAKEYKEIAEKTEEKLRTFQQDTEKREKEQKEALLKSKETEVSEFVESQVKAGRIIPALKAKAIAFMKSLTSEGEVLKFSEKNGATVTHTQLSLFKDLITKMTPVVPVGSEFSIVETVASETPDSEDGVVPAAPAKHFTDIVVGGQKKKVEVDEMDIAVKALQFQEESRKNGKPISYDEALIAIYPKNKSAVKA